MRGCPVGMVWQASFTFVPYSFKLISNSRDAEV
jgi:hypothetical protein